MRSIGAPHATAGVTHGTQSHFVPPHTEHFHGGGPDKPMKRPSIETPASAYTPKTPSQKVASKILQYDIFENAMATIILFNFVLVVVEADSTAEKLDDKSPTAPAWVDVSSWVTLAIFVIELMLRLFSERKQFFNDGWNTFDFLIISLDTICSLLELVIGSLIPVGALRILRLCKLARVSKIFRIFPELRLMMAGLIGSLRSIFWGMILLLFALLVWAVVGVQFIHPLNLKIAESGLYLRTGCERCPEAYSSVGKALMTLLQQSVAGDSWGLMTIPIIEETPAAALYFTGVLMTVSLAVMNLILGVVVNVAMESRDHMAEELQKERILQRVDAEKNLSQVCADMDVDGSGQLSKDELVSGYSENELFRQTLFELGITEEDLDILWTILDPDRDGQVPYSTFIHKSYSMKASDTEFMLAYIKYYVTRIRDQVLQGQQQLKEYFISAKGEKVNFGNQQKEEKLKYEKELTAPSDVILEDSTNDLTSGRPVAADSVLEEKGPSASLRLSEDDRRILDDILEKSQLWREELNLSMMGVNRRLDALVQDAVWTELPQRLGVKRAPTKKLWCCHPDSPEASTESVIGSSAGAADDAVQVSGHTEIRFPSSQSEQTPARNFI